MFITLQPAENGWKFNVLVHCVLQGSSLCFFSILAQGLSFVRLHFLFLSAQTIDLLWDISGMHWHWFVAFSHVIHLFSEFHVLFV